jgi:uncharacterized membrane protein
MVVVLLAIVANVTVIVLAFALVGWRLRRDRSARDSVRVWLRRIESLRASGAITDHEYAAQRTEMLRDL